MYFPIHRPYSAHTTTEKATLQKAEDGNIMPVLPHTEFFKLKHSETEHNILSLPAGKNQAFCAYVLFSAGKNDTIVDRSSATAAFIAIALSGSSGS